MRARVGRAVVASTIVGLAALLIVSGIPGLTEAYEPKVGTRQDEICTRPGDLCLIVGGQDQMKTRNLLKPIANDVWTSDVHYRAYHSVLLGHPTLDQPMAYIAKGVDVNQNNEFEAVEYDQWKKEAGTNALDVVLYYDFNGVYWHDGTQMTVWDVLFSYHVSAMNARFNTDLRVLYCSAIPTESYESCNNQLSISVFDLDADYSNGFQKNWYNEGNIPGNPAFRVALRYTLNQPFALFYESTVFPTMMPMHVWSRTGGGRHSDFGCAVWIPQAEATAKGIAECGTANSAKWGKGIDDTENVPGSSPFQYQSAEQWEITRDEDVIASGPFQFDSWVQDVEAKVVRYERYYTGVDPDNSNTVYDAQLASVLKKPTLDGIRFKKYSTTLSGVFALQTGEIDFYHWNVGADFVPDLLKVPEIAVEANAEPGFFYMAYNFRDTPWGYKGGDPQQGDIGLGFRKAASHLIDKKSIVQNLLQNFGVVGHGVISPANTFWYNNNIDKPEYELAQARSILDDLAQPGGLYPQVTGYTLDPAGPCTKDLPGQCRGIGAKGTALIEILTPDASYDPVRASAGAYIADAMQQVGINAISRTLSFGEIVNRINTHDFDLYILGWRVGGTDPDYLFSFFHSSNAAAGQNYPGYHNATFDQVVEDSRAELDRNTRQSLIFEAQRILALDRPYDVLYFRTNIEGYRQDRFVNWTVSSGTIWGFWSLQGLRQPSTRTLRASIVTESATKAGATELVTVTVFDHENKALAGANVTLSVDPGADQGNVSIAGGPAAKTVYGTTDANGIVRGSYIAANVQGETQVVIDSVARHDDFPDSSSRSQVIRVFPLGVQFLSARVDLDLGDRMTRGSSLPMSITVKDQDRNAVSDANVTVRVSPATGELTPDPFQGPASAMTSVTLTATPTATVDDYTVRVIADKEGYENATRTFLVSVVSVTGNYLCPDGHYVVNPSDCVGPSTPSLDAVLVLAGVAATALVAGAIVRRKRRS